MEVRAGYEQTEVGVIPKEWEVVPIFSLLAAPIQNGLFNERSRKGRGSKLINVIDLYGGFPLETAGLEKFAANKDELSRFAVRNGDIFFTRSSLTADGIAMCNVYRADGEDSIVFDCHIIRVRPDATKVEPLFLGRTCRSRAARRYLVTNAKTTTMTTIDQSVIARLPVAIPPLMEQRAIAAALSDMDALLAGLDRLIAKKRNIKQAAMQQLLSGQTRLPSFNDEWIPTRLGDLLSFKNGLNKAKEFFGHGTPIVNYMDVFSSPKLQFSQIAGRVSLTSAEIKNFDVRKGDVFFTRTSETTSEIGIAAVLLDEPVDTVFSGFVLRGRPVDKRLHDGFKAYCFASASVRKQIISKASYTTRALTNGRLLSGVVLRLPSLAEQAAIASVLSDMDSELAALEARRDKTRALKQGMMQELLTGRTRLVDSPS